MSGEKLSKEELQKLTERFERYAKKVKNLEKRPSDVVLLELYGHYKQAKFGKNTSSKPWVFQVEAKSKWDAWNKLGDTSKEDAMRKYIKLVKRLFDKD